MTTHQPTGRRLLATVLSTALATATLTVLGASTAPPASAAQAGAPHASYQAGRYLVTFADEPAATYEGGVAGYPRTRPDSGKKLNPTRAEVVKYRTRLAALHDNALQDRRRDQALRLLRRDQRRRR